MTNAMVKVVNMKYSTIASYEDKLDETVFSEGEKSVSNNQRTTLLSVFAIAYIYIYTYEIECRAISLLDSINSRRESD